MCAGSSLPFMCAGASSPYVCAGASSPFARAGPSLPFARAGVGTLSGRHPSCSSGWLSLGRGGCGCVRVAIVHCRGCTHC